jgi:GT2 family glycosyltransferase
LIIKKGLFVLGSRILRWISKLKFLIVALPGIVRFRRGLISCIEYYFDFLVSSGFRSLLGRLVTDAGYVLKNSKFAYQSWIKRQPQNQEITYIENIVVVADIRAWKVGEVDRFQEHLDGINGSIQILFFSEENSELKLHSDLSLLQIEARAAAVLFVKYPCEISNQMASVVKDFHSMGADTLVFDYDQVSSGQRCNPCFQPGVDSELYGQEKYNCCCLTNISHFLATLTLENSDDLGFRLLISAKKVQHVPQVLLHFIRSPKEWNASSEISYVGTEEAVKTSIIIPTRDRLDLLKPCVESLEATNQPASFEIIIVDNGSEDSETLGWLALGEAQSRFVVVKDNRPFNWSELNNIGAHVATGDCLIFLNNDTRSIQKDWIKRLAAQTNRSGIGAVGPMLLYEDGRIQHAGLVIGFGGCADHIYAGFYPDACTDSAFVDPAVTRTVTANTGACLAVSADLFEEIGGFNPSLPIAGDLEFCIRLMSKGYRNLYYPRVRVEHLESASRKRGLPEEERTLLVSLMQDVLGGKDSHYNENLSLDCLYPVPNWF